jgi:hypothetical protein
MTSCHQFAFSRAIGPGSGPDPPPAPHLNKWLVGQSAGVPILAISITAEDGVRGSDTRTEHQHANAATQCCDTAVCVAVVGFGRRQHTFRPLALRGRLAMLR